MRAVSPEPSLLLHMHNMGIHTAYSINQCSDSPEHACSLARAFTALAHAQNGRTYGIFLSVNTQSRLSIHAVLPEPSLLSHMRKMGVHRAYFISQCSDAPEHSYRLARAFTALAHTRGVQYVMKTAQYIPKFIFTHFIITFIKRSVSWLNQCKIAVVQLLIKF